MSGIAPSAEIVVIATSGRALAQSAAKSALRVRVLDAFADRDTRAAADTVCISVDGVIALDPKRLFAALGARAQLSGERVLVVGSGLERFPELLDRLAAYGLLCANDASVVAALKHPELAAELLRALDWTVPQTQRARPLDVRGWLHKEIGGAGGVHVRRADSAPIHANAYYQREVPGSPMSVTFLADGERAWILGFNTQFICAVGDAPFCYVGASTCKVEPDFAEQMQASLDRLVRVTGLRGLNGLDFLLDGAMVYVLEINPRPTATFELYDEDFPAGLVHWHIRSFLAPLSNFDKHLRQRHTCYRAYAVMFAQHPILVPADADFPSWCRDLPTDGSFIAAGAPVLSVFASGDNAAHAEHKLDERKRRVYAMLLRWKVDARHTRATVQSLAS